jgi:hypothetical protein
MEELVGLLKVAVACSVWFVVVWVRDREIDVVID